MVVAAPATRLRIDRVAPASWDDGAAYGPVERVLMRNLLIGVAASASLFGASQACGQTRTAAPAQLVFGVDRVGDIPGLTPAQFVYGGHDYCWYPSGWKGPGFYWCGYATRRGYGWGGPAGWMGYSYRGGAYYHGGAVYRGCAHGGHVNGPYGGSARGGTVTGPGGAHATGGTVTGPGGRSASGARVTGPAGESRTVVRGR
jgi:hypothetical protein